MARAFENTPRNTGVHASGILITPCDVTDVTPVIYNKEGIAVTLYPGPQLEEYNFVKYDVLGLKTLDLIQKTLNNIKDKPTVQDLYDKIAGFSDPKVYEMIREKKTDAVFQLSSDMMKGIVSEIDTSSFNDIVATNALGRPGPASVNMDKDYADTKLGRSDPKYPIRGCEDILDETFGEILYQEQLMSISKKIAGFDDSQADSITRKTIA